MTKQKQEIVLNDDVAHLWIDALTSGEYKQGVGRLGTMADDKSKRDGNRPDEFCCLGVLCDLYAKSHPEAHWKKKQRLDDYAVFIFDTGKQLDENEPETGKTYLPKTVAEWAGFPNNVHGTWNNKGEFTNGPHHMTLENGDTFHCEALTLLNDSNVPFSIIAESIKRYMTSFGKESVGDE